jgi:hypothetical protein
MANDFNTFRVNFFQWASKFVALCLANSAPPHHREGSCARTDVEIQGWQTWLFLEQISVTACGAWFKFIVYIWNITGLLSFAFLFKDVLSSEEATCRLVPYGSFIKPLNHEGGGGRKSWKYTKQTAWLLSLVYGIYSGSQQCSLVWVFIKRILIHISTFCELL